MKKEYNKINNESVFNVEGFRTVHFFKNYVAAPSHGEEHDFWEIFYCVRGFARPMIDGEVFDVGGGEVLFYAPLVHHSRCDFSTVSDIGILSFDCKSEAMEYFKNRKIVLNDKQKDMLGSIISRALACFEPLIGNPAYMGFKIGSEVAPAAMQFLKNELELLLIDLYDKSAPVKDRYHVIGDNRSNYYRNFTEKIEVYLNANICGNITLGDVAQEFNTSVSFIKRSFNEIYDCGLISHFIDLKILEAKRLIHETDMNFTQISEHLGFASIYYFSKLFKQRTGVTPTEYSRLVKIS